MVLTHLRIVAWLPGLVREHWPRGKVEVISMMSSSSSSSTSCTVSELEPAALYESRAWGSPAEGWFCRGGCGGRRTGEKALRRPASPVLQHFHGTATCSDYQINSERTKEQGIPLLMPMKVCRKFDAGNSTSGNPAHAGT